MGAAADSEDLTTLTTAETTPTNVTTSIVHTNTCPVLPALTLVKYINEVFLFIVISSLSNKATSNAVMFEGSFHSSTTQQVINVLLVEKIKKDLNFVL